MYHKGKLSQSIKFIAFALILIGIDIDIDPIPIVLLAFSAAPVQVLISSLLQLR
jgi:hypothetical protein